jgi:hypothetical protein
MGRKCAQNRSDMTIHPKNDAFFAIKCQKALANCAKGIYNNDANL